MIRFRDVTKKFPDETVALSAVSLVINDNEFVFLVGPSGAGKTTFLRLILGDFSPSSGQIEIDGQDITKLKGNPLVELRRSIGFVFQDLKLLADRNLFENVALSLEILGRSSREIKKEVGEALEKVGLSNQMNSFPSQMSGGELQRVALARAICGQPKYILADEPTGNVDPANAWSIIRILEDVNLGGTTVIMATHNSEVVDSLNKRVVRIESGKIISDQEGGKYHVYQN
jgi:cell division transport system ATP-binding protein